MTSRMFARWEALHQQELDAALAGPWHCELRELLDFLRTMTTNHGDELIQLVKRQGWHAANVGMRFMILREIDLGIARAREEAGLPSFDDSMPFTREAPTVFEVIKEFLLGDEASAACSSLSDRGYCRSD